MAFSDQEQAWGDYSGVADATPYDDIRTFVPFDEIQGAHAALCVFSPIRELATGRVVSWASVDDAGDRQAFINQVVRESLGVDRTWEGRFVAPLLGVVDPLCWTILDRVLPHS